MKQVADHAPTSVPGAALTAPERQIAALIGEGLTNQGIADRLGLERAIVSQHVASILWRLDLKDRREIAAWVATHE